MEIGSFCGLSTNMITYAKEKLGKKNKLITCDKWKFEGSNSVMLGDSTFVTHAEYKDFVKKSYMRNISMFSRFDYPYTLEMLSDEFFHAWSNEINCVDVLDRPIKLGGPISFCYIDGNHTYEQAKQDFINCDTYLEKDGFILFDDSADGSGWEVCKVIEEVIALERYAVIQNNPNYLFKKIMHDSLYSNDD